MLMMFAVFATYQERRHHRHDHLGLHLGHPGRVDDELVVADTRGSEDSEQGLFGVGLFTHIGLEFLQNEV